MIGEAALYIVEATYIEFKIRDQIDRKKDDKAFLILLLSLHEMYIWFCVKLF